MSEEKAKELGVKPLKTATMATRHTWVAGALGIVEPEIMASTKRKVLAKTGLTIDDFDRKRGIAAQSIILRYEQGKCKRWCYPPLDIL